MRARDAAEAEQRVEYRDTAVLGELAQLLAGLAEDHAVPGDDQRPLGGVDQLGGAGDLVLVSGAGGVIAADGDLLRPDELRLVDEHVLGDVDVHGTGAAGGGQVGRLGEGVREVLGVHHQVVVLDARHQDAGRVGLLEAVPPDHVAPRRCPSRTASAPSPSSRSGPRSPGSSRPARRWRVRSRGAPTRGRSRRRRGRRPARGAPGYGAPRGGRASGRRAGGQPRRGSRIRCRCPRASDSRGRYRRRSFSSWVPSLPLRALRAGCG